VDGAGGCALWLGTTIVVCEGGCGCELWSLVGRDDAYQISSPPTTMIINTMMVHMDMYHALSDSLSDSLR
jgi:hypothetical protein